MSRVLGAFKSDGWAQSLAAFIHRRAGLVVLVALAITAVAGWMASNLRVDQEMRRLLPDDFPSVVRLDRLQEEIGQQSHLYVTVRSPDREANIAFGRAVYERIAERDDIRYVLFERDLKFFDDHALLYASMGDLIDLRRRVILRIREEVRKEAYGDFSVLTEEDRAAKPSAEKAANDLGFDVDEVKQKYGLKDAAAEYMEADEGRVMVVKIRPTAPSTDVAFSNALSSDIRSITQELDPSSFHPEMEIDLNGAYVQHAKRVKDVQTEIYGGAFAAAALLLLTLGVYYRSVRSILLIFVPLLASVVGALAFGWLVYGVLNLVSAFIFGVLLGLGIDFGIHVLSRIRQERARGLPSQDAIRVALATSGKTTAAGAISTALAFGALTVADFQGFAQFGLLAAVGVVLALVSALAVMPSLMVVLDRVRPWKPPREESSAEMGRWARPFRILGLTLGLGGLGVAVWAGAHIGDLEFEHDLKQLGRRRSKPTGPQKASYRDAAGRAQTVDPMIALVEQPSQALAIQRQLDALDALTEPEVAQLHDLPVAPTRPLPEPPPPAESEAPAQGDDDWGDDEGGDDWDSDADDDIEEFGDKDFDDPKFKALEEQAVAEAVMSPQTFEQLKAYPAPRLSTMKDRLNDVWSIYAFVPRQQEEKLAIIRDIRARIDAKRGSLGDEAKAQIDEWYHYLAADQPVTVERLPDYVKSQFEDKQGTVGRFVIIASHGSKADARNAERIYDAYGQLQTPDGPVDTAADFFVIPEIYGAIERDGPIVMGLAITIMLLTALVLLRRWGAAASVAVTVGLSLLWLAAVMLVLGWKLNFFNIIVLPLLLGMGQDDALHLAERHHEEGGKLGRVLREAGGAIFVTTLTTIWGFSGILFANHRGLNSMAWIAVIGMALALVASVVVLPLLLELLARRRK